MRGLNQVERYRAIRPHSAKFAVEISLRYRQLFSSVNDRWVFAGLIEPSVRQQLHASAVKARVHPVAVEFDLVQPLRAGWWLFDQFAELRLHECRKRRSSRTAYASEVRSGFFLSRSACLTSSKVRKGELDVSIAPIGLVLTKALLLRLISLPPPRFSGCGMTAYGCSSCLRLFRCSAASCWMAAKVLAITSEADWSSGATDSGLSAAGVSRSLIAAIRYACTSGGSRDWSECASCRSARLQRSARMPIAIANSITRDVRAALPKQTHQAISAIRSEGM